MKQAIGFCLAAILAMRVCAAEPTSWKLDKAHSQVRFSVSHLVITEVTGRFTDFDVTLTQPDDDFTKSQIQAIVKTASINTDVEQRDRHLRTDDFFNAEKFPTMTFKSTSIEKTGEGKYKITGDLTIRDVTRSVELDTKFNGTIVDPRGNTREGFKATTTINRFDFGVKWDMATETGGLVAGKEVEITLLMEFVKGK